MKYLLPTLSLVLITVATTIPICDYREIQSRDISDDIPQESTDPELSKLFAQLHQFRLDNSKPSNPCEAQCAKQGATCTSSCLKDWLLANDMMTLIPCSSKCGAWTAQCGDKCKFDQSAAKKPPPTAPPKGGNEGGHKDGIGKGMKYGMKSDGSTNSEEVKDRKTT